MLFRSEGLDRTYGNVVESLRCDLSDSRLQIHLETLNGILPSLEIYTADNRKGLLEEVFGVKVEFPTHHFINQPDRPAIRESRGEL